MMNQSGERSDTKIYSKNTLPSVPVNFERILGTNFFGTPQDPLIFSDLFFVHFFWSSSYYLNTFSNVSPNPDGNKKTWDFQVVYTCNLHCFLFVYFLLLETPTFIYRNRNRNNISRQMAVLHHLCMNISTPLILVSSLMIKTIKTRNSADVGNALNVLVLYRWCHTRVNLSQPETPTGTPSHHLLLLHIVHAHESPRWFLLRVWSPENGSADVANTLTVLELWLFRYRWCHNRDTNPLDIVHTHKPQHFTCFTCS